jgi:hypothetical protein
MGVLPHQLACDLRDRLGLVRAIETGTYKGDSARILASIFAEVVTIELDPALHKRAADRLAGIPAITAVQGSSRDRLAPLIDRVRPTFYWLDGHWSGGTTAGENDECPVLDELGAVAEGHPDDCVLIDDARLFLEPPPPPHKPDQWPSLDEIVAAIHTTRPEHRVEVRHDIVVAVPPSASDLVDRFASSPPARASLIRRALSRALER